MEENVKQSGFFSDEMTIIKGVVATSNNLVIAGKFTGTIASIASVTISEGAEVEADIMAHLQKHGFDYPYILHTLYIKKGRSDTPLT